MENKNEKTKSAEVENSANEKVMSRLWKLQIFEQNVREVYDVVGKREDILKLLNQLADKYDASASSPNFGDVLYEGDVCRFEIEYDEDVHWFFIRISSIYETYEDETFDDIVEYLDGYMDYHYN